MQDLRDNSTAGAEYDRSLLDWFATLSPEHRLAELESRISFFLSVRVNDESELSRDSRTPQQTRG